MKLFPETHAEHLEMMKVRNIWQPAMAYYVALCSIVGVFGWIILELTK